MKKLIPLFLIALLCAMPAWAAKATTNAPDVTFTDVNGTQHKISDFKGKTVVLEWNNPECPFVKKFYDAGEMQKLQADAVKKGVVWITVNSNAAGEQGHLADDKAAKAYMEEVKIASTTYVRDPAGELGKAFGAKVTPHMFVINPEGKLAYQGAIDSIKSANASDIAKAENYVVKAVAAAAENKISSPSNTEAYGCGVKY
ncbi:MAG TPA: thioredoxin family protein [Rhodospirillaceae bacterium]|nr:thioredoxin family protein [Rhodospirillaceae bacterium]